MRANNLRLLLASLICVALSSGANSASKVLVRVPGATYFFGLSASPVGGNVFLFSSEEEPEYPLLPGIPTLVRLGGQPTPTVAQLNVPSALDDLTLPVWSSDGQTVYFHTTAGIYALDIGGGRPDLLFEGRFEGLALSSDNSLMAFWRWETPRVYALRLLVYEVEHKKLVRSWQVPIEYAADKWGFEIAFARDGTSVFAKTYDSEDSVMLKEFRIDTGEVRTVLEHCKHMAASRHDIYVVGVVGGKRSLLKISGGKGEPEIVVEDFPYNELFSSGSRRWIVAYDARTETWAIYDSDKTALSLVKDRCDMVTVLSDGEVIVPLRILYYQ